MRITKQRLKKVQATIFSREIYASGMQPEDYAGYDL